jgi:DNA-binding transcriptional MerR regulator
MSNGPIEIPNKSSFKINEVCALTGVKSYVLRFWESEFPEIAPMMSSSGVKLYEHRDIEAILLIKKLLFDEKMSIEKVKGQLKLSMPKEHLVEDAFNDTIESHISNSHQTYEFNLKAPKVNRVINDSEFQSLLSAKNKLTALLEKAQSIENRNHWV